MTFRLISSILTLLYTLGPGLLSLTHPLNAQEITLSLNGPIYTQLDPIAYTVTIQPKQRISINGLARLIKYKEVDLKQVGELQYYSFKTRKWKPMGLYPGMDWSDIWTYTNLDSLVKVYNKYYHESNYVTKRSGDTLSFEGFLIPVTPQVKIETVHVMDPYGWESYFKSVTKAKDYYIFEPDSIKIRFKLNNKGRKRYSNELMVRYTESKAFTDLFLNHLEFPFLYTYFFGKLPAHVHSHYRKLDMPQMENMPSLAELDSLFGVAASLCKDKALCEYVRIFPALFYSRGAFIYKYNLNAYYFNKQVNPAETVRRLNWLMQEYPKIESKYLKELILFHLNRATYAVVLDKSEIEAISQFVFFYRSIKE